MSMNKKKNKFWTLVFSAVPGAGQMYMGFMKRGLSLMTIFCGICGFAIWANMGPLLLAAVVCWFYSFFDVWNLRSLPDEVFQQITDDYTVHMADGQGISYLIFRKYRKITAVALIVTGSCVLIRRMNQWIDYWLPSGYYNPFSDLFGYQLPQLVVSIVIIIIGISMIRGKKQELDLAEEYPELPELDLEAEKEGE